MRSWAANEPGLGESGEASPRSSPACPLIKVLRLHMAALGDLSRVW